MSRIITEFRLVFCKHKIPITKTINILCSENEFQRLIEQNNTKIDHIETTYGILDCDGGQLSNGMLYEGYTSYEIDYRYISKIMTIFKDILKPYIQPS